MRGQKAVDWRLVDEIVLRSRFEQTVAERAAEFAAASDRPRNARGVPLTPLSREITAQGLRYPHLRVDYDRELRCATLTLLGPEQDAPANIDQLLALGADFWPLALARELDDALLHLRSNEPELGTLTFKTAGDQRRVAAHDAFLEDHASAGHWLAREIVLYWKRTLKRLDVTSRTPAHADRTGKLFRRAAGRTGVRRRPQLYAGRPVRG